MSKLAFPVESVVPLHDEDYGAYLLEAIRASKLRIWASIFIVDVRFLEDRERRVRTVLQELSFARWRGVDVRLVLGDSDRSAAIHVANGTSRRYADSLGVPVRTFRHARQSTHSKYVVIDDHSVLVGSQNWTHGAFGDYAEDAVAVRSSDLNTQLALDFEEAWLSAASGDEPEGGARVR